MGVVAKASPPKASEASPGVGVEAKASEPKASDASLLLVLLENGSFPHPDASPLSAPAAGARLALVAPLPPKAESKS